MNSIRDSYKSCKSRIPNENHANQENLRIPYKNHEKNENCEVQQYNNENHEKS